MPEADGMRINFRADSYFILESRILCHRCKTLTPVFALALPETHERRRSNGDSSESGAWDAPGCPVALSHVRHVNVPVATRIRGMTACYRIEANKVGQTFWTNHCLLCDAPMDETELRAYFLSAVDEALQSGRGARTYAVSQPVEALADGHSRGACRRQRTVKGPQRGKRG
jgi:hypothetical protein